jgi:hypothetical protein
MCRLSAATTHLPLRSVVSQGHVGRTFREMLDSLGACVGLVVAAGVERQLADELPLEVDDEDLLIGDEELDCAAFVGSSEADF